MIELPTPETDAAAVKNIYGVASEVDVDFARRLEHERDEARAKLEDWEDSAKHVRSEWPDEQHCSCVPILRKLLKDAEGERDDARDWLGSYKESVSIAAREINNLKSENAKLRDIAERAIELALAYYDGPCERDGAKLRLELDQLKEGGK
jgi:phage shock protein A